MTRITTRFAAILTPIVLLTAQAAPSFAAETQLRANVTIGDLNLATKEGKNALALRAERAANQLCEGAGAEWYAANRREARRCADRIKAEIVAKAMAGTVQFASR